MIIATFGNVLCLCVGGSVISIIEMIYYFTFRLYSEITHPHPSGQDETVKSPTINEDSDNDVDNLYDQQNEDKLRRMMTKSNNNNAIVVYSHSNMTQYGYYP